MNLFCFEIRLSPSLFVVFLADDQFAGKDGELCKKMHFWLLVDDFKKENWRIKQSFSRWKNILATHSYFSSSF